ncbi:MAG: ABC transporter substrate-binding protein [Holosporales bacterium]|jgi:putative ABC transport system substrate-binding protein|nr:ABC transporter substrate-binding protein [Holosporales bacterium]
MQKKNIFIIAVAAAIACSFVMLCKTNDKKDIPIVAIANYGPLPDLELSIKGIKEELTEQGFIENETVKYEISSINFDHSLISQTATNLKSYNPRVMIVISTPIAQFAKGKIQDIPLVFHAITDPVAAGLLKDKDRSNGNVTGSSDLQNLDIVLTFAKSILPRSKTVGLLCLTSDDNDATLANMMKEAAPKIGLSVLVIPVEQARDIPIRMQGFKEKVDFIYVGASGLHAAMPTIASEAQKMNIPVFDSEDQSVRNGFALASFGVNYESIGRNTGKLVAKLLKETDIKNLPPVYPTAQEHRCFVNKKQAEKYGINIPENAEIVG